MRFLSRTIDSPTDMAEWQAQVRDDRDRLIINTKQEIPRSDLVFGRHWIEDRRDGSFYRAWAGDPQLSSHMPGLLRERGGRPGHARARRQP